MKEAGQERLAPLATRCSCDGRTFVLFLVRDPSNRMVAKAGVCHPRARASKNTSDTGTFCSRGGGGLSTTSTTSTSSIPPRSRKSQSPIHDDLIMDQRGPTIDSLGDPWESRSSRCTSFEAPNLKRAGRILCQWSIMRRKEP
jgi:hypothetical protein